MSGFSDFCLLKAKKKPAIAEHVVCSALSFRQRAGEYIQLCRHTAMTPRETAFAIALASSEPTPSEGEIPRNRSTWALSHAASNVNIVALKKTLIVSVTTDSTRSNRDLPESTRPRYRKR